MPKFYLSLPQCVYLVSMLAGSQLLEPINFTLERGALALQAEPLERMGALERRSWMIGTGSNARNKLGVPRT